MHPTSEPVERADATPVPSTFTMLIPATGSRIRIRRMGAQVRVQVGR